MLILRQQLIVLISGRVPDQRMWLNIIRNMLLIEIYHRMFHPTIQRNVTLDRLGLSSTLLCGSI